MDKTLVVIWVAVILFLASPFGLMGSLIGWPMLLQALAGDMPTRAPLTIEEVQCLVAK